MTTYSELRAQAWKISREGHWIAKFVLVWMTLAFVLMFVQGLWGQAIEVLAIQTWSTFLQAKAQALASGLDLTVPSRTVALRMSEATAFEVFINCILNGIVCFAMAGLLLRAAKGDGERWFSRAFGGFKYPLGVAWLYFRYVFQVAFWTLFLIVPGLVAVYRYCQCWNLKVEHPDWSAGKCLAESGRMMAGHKWERFSLDCSFWRPITLLLLGLLALTSIVGLGSLGMLSGMTNTVATGLGLALSLACCWGGIVLAVYMSVGQALFYLELKGKTNG